MGRKQLLVLGVVLAVGLVVLWWGLPCVLQRSGGYKPSALSSPNPEMMSKLYTLRRDHPDNSADEVFRGSTILPAWCLDAKQTRVVVDDLRIIACGERSSFLLHFTNQV